jgi:hypothetical protein
MRAVTDSTRGIIGYSGAHVHDLGPLLMSNGAGIALTETQGLTSNPTLEVLNFIYDIHNTEGVARWSEDVDYWDNSDWSDGTLAFFIWVPWTAQRNGVTKGFGFADYEECPYVIRTVPWPTGPSGNRDTNASFNLSGNVFMIPAGTVDADIVFEVFYGYHNWYNYDLDLRDYSVWTENLFGDDYRGFQYAMEMITRPQFDMYAALDMQNADGGGFYTGALLDGSETPAQFAESWRNIVQDYIDVAYGKK